jgi:hypothetical protein
MFMQYISTLTEKINRNRREYPRLSLPDCWLLAKLDCIADTVGKRFNTEGWWLVYHLGHWRILEDGQLTPLDDRGQKELVELVRSLSRELKVPLTWTWRHLKASQAFAPHWPPFSDQPNPLHNTSLEQKA